MNVLIHDGNGFYGALWDAAMKAATVDSKTIAADSTETGLIGGRSAAGVGPSAPVVADGTPVPDSKGWWW